MVNEQPNVAPMGRYWTMDTCRLLGISYNTLMRHVRAGEIVSHMGKSRWFYGSDIVKFWRER